MYKEDIALNAYDSFMEDVKSLVDSKIEKVLERIDMESNRITHANMLIKMLDERIAKLEK